MKRIMARWTALALMMTLMMTLPAPALAARPDARAQEAEELAAVAKAEFKAGEFEKAARSFMAAYGRSKKAPLVFNAARAYEEAAKVGDAAALFRLYISISDDPDGIRDAQARLEKLEYGRRAPGTVQTVEPARPPAVAPPAVVEGPAAKGVPQAASAPPAPPAPPTVSVPSVAAKPAIAAAVERSAKPEPTRAASSVPWLVGLAGVAAMGAGAGLMAIGSRDSDAANALPVRTEQEVEAYHTSYDNAYLRWASGAALTCVGVAATSIGIWLWARDPAPRIAVVPDPAGGGLAISGRW